MKTYRCLKSLVLSAILFSALAHPGLADDPPTQGAPASSVTTSPPIPTPTPGSISNRKKSNKSGILRAIKALRKRHSPNLDTLAGRIRDAIDSQDSAQQERFEKEEFRKAAAFKTLGKGAGIATAAGGAGLGVMGIFSVAGGNIVGLGVAVSGVKMTAEGFHLFNECGEQATKHLHAANLVREARKAQKAGTYKKGDYDDRAEHFHHTLDELVTLAIESGDSKIQRKFEKKHFYLSQYYTAASKMSVGVKMGGAVLITSGGVNALTGSPGDGISQVSDGINVLFGSNSMKSKFKRLAKEHLDAARAVQAARFEREGSQTDPSKLTELPKDTQKKSGFLKYLKGKGRTHKIVPIDERVVDDISIEDTTIDLTSTAVSLEDICLVNQSEPETKTEEASSIGD